MISTGIDWAAKPAPWCDIGPQFRRACEAIMNGKRPALPPFRSLKYRDAKPPDPAHQDAVARRAAEIAAAKAELDANHQARADGVTRNPGGRPKGPRYFADDDMNDAADEIARAASRVGE